MENKDTNLPPKWPIDVVVTFDDDVTVGPDPTRKQLFLGPILLRAEQSTLQTRSSTEESAVKS